MHGRLTARIALLATLAAGGCASDPARVTDVQVRSGDRPECQLSWRRGPTGGPSGTESQYDPCGNIGTFPILTSDAMHAHPRR